MRQIESKYKTFAKGTIQEIKELIPSAKSIKKATGGNYLIKGAKGETLGTWHTRFSKKGLIIIW